MPFPEIDKRQNFKNPQKHPVICGKDVQKERNAGHKNCNDSFSGGAPSQSFYNLTLQLTGGGSLPSGELTVNIKFHFFEYRF